MLLFASRAIGLEVEVHRCQTLRLFQPTPTALRRLADLPVTVDAEQGWAEVHGLPPSLLTAVLQDCLGEHRTVGRACDCHLKTALVVASSRDAWRAALHASPFGHTLVQDSWPYLGATVAGPTGGPPHMAVDGRGLQRRLQGHLAARAAARPGAGHCASYVCCLCWTTRCRFEYLQCLPRSLPCARYFA